MASAFETNRSDPLYGRKMYVTADRHIRESMHESSTYSDATSKISEIDSHRKTRPSFGRVIGRAEDRSEHSKQDTSDFDQSLKLRMSQIEYSNYFMTGQSDNSSSFDDEAAERDLLGGAKNSHLKVAVRDQDGELNETTTQDYEDETYFTPSETPNFRQKLVLAHECENDSERAKGSSAITLRSQSELGSNSINEVVDLFDKKKPSSTLYSSHKTSSTRYETLDAEDLLDAGFSRKTGSLNRDPLDTYPSPEKRRLDFGSEPAEDMKYPDKVIDENSDSDDDINLNDSYDETEVAIPRHDLRPGSHAATTILDPRFSGTRDNDSAVAKSESYKLLGLQDRKSSELAESITLIEEEEAALKTDEGHTDPERLSTRGASSRGRGSLRSSVSDMYKCPPVHEFRELRKKNYDRLEIVLYDEPEDDQVEVSMGDSNHVDIFEATMLKTRTKKKSDTIQGKVCPTCLTRTLVLTRKEQNGSFMGSRKVREFLDCCSIVSTIFGPASNYELSCLRCKQRTNLE
eukprot:CAMPEP_0115034420 /NCGR_PEP_ID=MMETSP0216-20121206/40636_1 /TAXON_ID=223996 /ORGANISM="Protocruzia adherens, Strain Boccale" /LENGTH=516 /DNA_ID=CAMNT_0002413293 /DNA_START=132 /DNA_END=1682 /DNA_ORIENTATION=-